MKAIAKYLPIEGEINIGDTVIFPNGVIGTILSPNKKTSGGFGYAIDYNQGVGKAKEVLESLRGKEKLTKLFAVTQDIEVGDEINYVPDLPHLKKGMVTHKITEKYDGDFIMDDGYLMPNNGFKILGELSPNATWVKEGEEIEINEGWDKWEGPEGIEPVICQVLGPCGHYH